MAVYLWATAFQELMRHFSLRPYHDFPYAVGSIPIATDWAFQAFPVHLKKSWIAY
jgi:hypothetical protein